MNLSWCSGYLVFRAYISFQLINLVLDSKILLTWTRQRRPAVTRVQPEVERNRLRRTDPDKQALREKRSSEASQRPDSASLIGLIHTRWLMHTVSRPRAHTHAYTHTNTNIHTYKSRQWYILSDRHKHTFNRCNRSSEFIISYVTSSTSSCRVQNP